MYAKNIHKDTETKSRRSPVFGELGNVGEALFRGLGQQYMQDRVKLTGTSHWYHDLSTEEIADVAETATIALLVSILPAPDRAAAQDIVAAGMSVDHLPVALSDHRIQEGVRA